MKKFLAIFFVLSICFSLVSCEKKLTASNIEDYVFIDLSFGEIQIYEYEDTDLSGNIVTKYYMTSLCYIDVFPKSDYSFSNTSLKINIPENGSWKVYNLTDEPKPGFSNPLLESFPSDWEVEIKLDKEGYGSTTAFVYAIISDSLFGDFKKEHPCVEYNWQYKIKSVSGSVVKN